MDINKEMHDLLTRWADYCEQEELSKADLLISAGKAVANFTSTLIFMLDLDEEREEEVLDNYLANVQRLTMTLLKHKKEQLHG